MQKYVIDKYSKAFFTCQRCFQLSKNPQECKYCKLITCYECIKNKFNYFCLKFNFRGCSCIDDIPENLNQMTQFFYDRFQSHCENCEELVDNKCLRKEQQAFQYFLHKERLSNFKSYPKKNLTPLKCKICLKLPFEPLKNKFQNNYNCNDCVQKDLSNYHHLDENSIEEFNNLVMKCKVCQQVGNFFEMKNHKIYCTLEKVSCKCGWIGQKSQYKTHLIQCLSNEINQETILLNKQITTQRLVMRYCYISKAILTKQESKLSKFIKEFYRQENFPDYERSSQSNSSSEQLYNIYDFQDNFELY